MTNQSKNSLNSLFAELKTPLSGYFHDRLFLELDDAGHILNFWEKDSFHYPLFQDFLNPACSIFNIFDFKTQGSLKEVLVKESGHVAVKSNIPASYLFFDKVYTDIPMAHIKILESGAGRFLGIISFPRLLPNIHYAEPNPLLYLDHEYCIRICSERFAGMFKTQYPDPREIIGKPVASFIHPSPQSFANDLLVYLRHNPRTRFSAVGRQSNLTGVHSNRNTEMFYLPLSGTVDTRSHDFRLTLKAGDIQGTAPLLIVNNRLLPDPESALWPNGYEASEHAGWGFQLKRDGIVVEYSGRAASRPNTEFTLEKRGKTLLFYIDNQMTLTHSDPHFMEHEETRFYIGLRAGTSARIDNVTLETIVRDEALCNEQRPIIETLTEPLRHFYLTRFYNLSLSSSYCNLMAFILMDVTPLKEQTERLNRDYEREKSERSALEKLVGRMSPEKELFVGNSPAILELKERAEHIADVPAPVLIEGPTGAGKEVLARTIHHLSARRHAPFVKIDCSALPASLIESELFGYEKGAFTGADSLRHGRFEQAQHGTIFLDEIANLTLATQAKLLNVLQDHVITRIGGKEAIMLDIRIIAASNVRLETLLAQGLFREDLFYRINTLRFTLPPLSKRVSDIPLLCKHFIAQLNDSLNKTIKDFSPAAYRKLMTHPWPGNIRELHSVVQNAMIFSSREIIQESEITFSTGTAVNREKKSYHLEDVGRGDFIELLKKYRGKVTRVAKELGISTRACYYNFKLYKIDHKVYRKRDDGSTIA